MYLPVLHQANLSLSGCFFSRLCRKCWGGCHNNSRGDGASWCCADLVCLYISRGSLKKKDERDCKTLKHCDLVKLHVSIINLNIHFGLKGEKMEQMILTKILKEPALFGSLLRNNFQFNIFISIETWVKEVLTYICQNAVLFC